MSRRINNVGLSANRYYDRRAPEMLNSVGHNDTKGNQARVLTQGIDGRVSEGDKVQELYGGSGNGKLG
jgi:hypothetical protein